MITSELFALRKFSAILPSPSYSFKRHERLKSRKLIARVFKEGKSFHVSPVKLFYLVTGSDTEGIQAGFVASSRTFKKAVDRNRIKRLMREAYRLEKALLSKEPGNKQASLAVFFVYTGRELPPAALVNSAVQGVLRRLVKSFHEKVPSNT